MTASDWQDYSVIATGSGEKLERWGDVILLRPDPQVIWKESFPLKDYPGLSARYVRSKSGGGEWQKFSKMPEEWTIGYKDLTFLIKPMGFKHTGLFPEQAANWDLMRSLIKKSGKRVKILNLFGYTGGASVALAKEGAFVTHVDAAKGMVERCRENAAISKVPSDGIRYIVDDCKKFVQREIKRANKYDAILMDPPSYGRGPNGEMWRLEDSLYELTELTRQLLSDDPLFFLINSYTTGLGASVMMNIISVSMGSLKGKTDGYELLLPTQESGIVLPCGNTAFKVFG